MVLLPHIMKIKHLFLCFFFTLSVFAQAQDKAIWQSVFGGNVIERPFPTSYGFVVITDGGILSACKTNGTVLWRKNIDLIENPLVITTADDFIYITSKTENKIQMYNPDGNILWSDFLKQPATAPPVLGIDGRIFIAGSDILHCFGRKGTKKWEISLPQKSEHELAYFNDGSLLYIPIKTEQNVSIGFRISPYGEILEKITFTGIISKIQICNNGVLIHFTNQSFALVNVIEKKTQTLWTFSTKTTPFDIIAGDNNFCVIYKNNSVAEYSQKNGKQIWVDTLKTKNTTVLKNKHQYYATFSNDSYILKIQNTVLAYQSQQYNSKNRAKAKILWEKTVPMTYETFFPLVIFLEQEPAYLIVSNNNWLVSSYLIYPNTKTSNPIPEAQAEKKILPFLYTPNYYKKNKRQSLASIKTTLKNGNYGENERIYLTTILNYVQKYKEEYFEPQERTKNLAEKAEFLPILSLIEQDFYDSFLVLMLEQEHDFTLINTILQTMAQVAYDPHEKMITAIESFYHKNKFQLPTKTLEQISTAIFKICLFNGNKIFNKKGKKILGEMLLPDSPIQVQIKTREFLLHIINLEI